VKFNGTAPEPKKLEVTKDKEVCGIGGELRRGPGGRRGRRPQERRGGDHQHHQGQGDGHERGRCSIRRAASTAARVILTPANAPEIKNSDGILHNIHTYSEKNPPINRAQPKFKKVIKEKFASRRCSR
jgi:hypothetical protein